MSKIKVTLADESGTVLDTFIVIEDDTSKERLATLVREAIEMRHEVEEDRPQPLGLHAGLGSVVSHDCPQQYLGGR